ncbi:MAG: hypothetical protein ACK5JT_00735 [Hyphomicrobiaceae bacterium]
MLRFGSFATLPVAVLGISVLVGGCSLDSSALTTSSLFGSGKPAAPKPETPEDRLLSTATVAARAQRCGYVFDPQSVRAQYLAFEASKGSTPDQISKIEKGYDYTFAKVAKGVASDPDYCTPEHTTSIKAGLGRLLAGNFSAPHRKNQVEVSAWGTSDTTPMDRDKIFNPQPMR